jgi:hypothetical protein
MGRLAGLALLILCLSGCAVGASRGSLAARSPSPSAVQATAIPTVIADSPSPSPLPSPGLAIDVFCQGGGGASSMVLLQSRYSNQQQLYDVSDPLHPRRLCLITGTTAHVLTGDTFEYLKPVSGIETDVILRSLGSGNGSVAGKFPFYAPMAAWLPDQSVVAYTLPVSADNANLPDGGVAVHLFAHGQTGYLFTYPIPPTDCICRFGLPPQTLAVSPDGQYVVAGWPIGKGGEPLRVFRVSDRIPAITLDPTIVSVSWERTGHRLFLGRGPSNPEESWTPEAGLVQLAGASAWSFLPGQSPDGGLVAYTAYLDPPAQSQLRVYVYDLKAGTTRMLSDKLRSQVLFVKDGWVWYLEEAACDPAACNAPWGTQPTGKVFAMQLTGGVETQVTFATEENPIAPSDGINWVLFGPGEFWPAS